MDQNPAVSYCYSSQCEQHHFQLKSWSRQTPCECRMKAFLFVPFDLSSQMSNVALLSFILHQMVKLQRLVQGWSLGPLQLRAKRCLSPLAYLFSSIDVQRLFSHLRARIWGDGSNSRHEQIPGGPQTHHRQGLLGGQPLRLLVSLVLRSDQAPAVTMLLAVSMKKAGCMSSCSSLCGFFIWRLASKQVLNYVSVWQMLIVLLETVQLLEELGWY